MKKRSINEIEIVLRRVKEHLNNIYGDRIKIKEEGVPV